MPAPRIDLVCAVAIFAALAGPSATAGADEIALMTQVRSSDAAIRELVESARVNSATFNRLVEAVNATDGIVYIEPGRCGHPGIRSCLMLSVTQAGPHRVLRIVVDTRRASRDLAGAIGHELQHALEVLSDRTVTNSSAIFFFYKSHGRLVKGIFETDAAIVAGDSVRAELRTPRVDFVANRRLASCQLSVASCQASVASVRPNAN